MQRNCVALARRHPSEEEVLLQDTWQFDVPWSQVVLLNSRGKGAGGGVLLAKKARSPTAVPTLLTATESEQVVGSNCFYLTLVSFIILLHVRSSILSSLLKNRLPGVGSGGTGLANSCKLRLVTARTVHVLLFLCLQLQYGSRMDK